MNMSCEDLVEYSTYESYATHNKEPPNARPHGIIGQLSPATLMHHCSLVYTTTNKVHQHRNHYNDTKHAAWAERLFRNMYTSTCERRSTFEEVCTLVYSGDKRHTGLC